ncbi:hypothetical protein FSP39_013443 [Pinctada imbricata]|uniref:C2H2-type domain-containing protein n=1 Tax=Pinctada imbricata TaxID=66713 RepID=A0AA89BUQ7_PINIB|nr:hypothetical protein FSP39_013443 [Pinctada imbricata]
MNSATLLRPIPVYGGVPQSNKEALKIFQPWRTDEEPSKPALRQAFVSLQNQIDYQELARRALSFLPMTGLSSMFEWKGLPERKMDVRSNIPQVNLSPRIVDTEQRVPNASLAYSNSMLYQNKNEQLPNQFVAGRKVFPCPHCRYTTDRRNNLKRHMLTMHQTCPKLLECCGILFSTKAALREHATIFHYHGYHCYYCGRRFCRKALLKRHLSVHSGQKDYTCQICDYATSHKSNLERHRKVHFRQYGDTECDDDHTSEMTSSKSSDPDVCLSSDDEIDVSSD